MTRATIIVPAHNEASVIGRTLSPLAQSVLSEDFHVVVVANGCTDATAHIARSVLPKAIVVETATPGKCNALNTGFKEADPDKPVLCLDADIEVTAEAINALIDAVCCDAPVAACGAMNVDTAETSFWVRNYYKGWRTNPYFDKGKFGGLFALSSRAAARVFPLPHITADDEFVRRSFKPNETIFVPNCLFTARAPKTLSSLWNVRSRSLRGAREVSNLGFRSPETGSFRRVLWRAVQRPSMVFPVLVYCTVNTLVRVQGTVRKPTHGLHWERDLTTRAAG